METRPTASAVRPALATTAFCLVHSLLASRRAKNAFKRAAGIRARNGLYRPLFNTVAIVSSALLARYLWKQPARTLYHVKGPAAALMGAGQVLAGGRASAAAMQIGVARIGGLPNLAAWLAGKPHIPRAPEAQTIDPSSDGRIHPRGPFRQSRQPLNFWPIPLIWLKPRLTTTSAAFNLVATAYFYVGSMHSEHRLRQRYGAAYEAYQRSGANFFLPLGSAKTPAARGCIPASPRRCPERGGVASCD
jgi:protein-S-isoprenylcysteine O-methyltransferase Ste14